MIVTTLNRIWDHRIRADKWRMLLAHLGKTQGDDVPLPFSVIVEAAGLDAALDCCRVEPQHDQKWRRFAVGCGRKIQHLLTDPRSLWALDVAERYSRGEADDAELAAARDAAESAELAADKAAWEAARVVPRDIEYAAQKRAEWEAARAAAWATNEDAARAAGGSARAAARAVARAAVAKETEWEAAKAAAWEEVITEQTAEFLRLVS